MLESKEHLNAAASVSRESRRRSDTCPRLMTAIKFILGVVAFSKPGYSQICSGGPRTMTRDEL
jgi:hypothetical protein